MYVQCLGFLSKPERSYCSLTLQFETVIIKVAALRLRAHPWQLDRAKHSPSGFYSLTALIYIRDSAYSVKLSPCMCSYSSCPRWRIDWYMIVIPSYLW